MQGSVSQFGAGCAVWREKGSSLTSALLTPKPPASSVYVHVLEAPSPLKWSISVMCPFPSPRFIARWLIDGVDQASTVLAQGNGD